MTPQTAPENGSSCDTALAIASPARVPGYRVAHARVQAARGPASAYVCECGSQAADWAYQCTDPDELIDIVNGTPLRYSLDSDQYLPMCRPCHRRYDHAIRVISRW